MNKRAFLSFKITGLDRNKVLEISNRLEMIALKMHLQPVNPMRIVPQSVANSDSEQAWRQAMTITFPELLACNTLIVYAPGLDTSDGAKIELFTATLRNYLIYFINEDFEIQTAIDPNDYEKTTDKLDVACSLFAGMGANLVS